MVLNFYYLTLISSTKIQRSRTARLRASPVNWGSSDISRSALWGGSLSLPRGKESDQRKRAPGCAASRFPALLGRGGLHRRGILAATMKASAPASPRVYARAISASSCGARRSQRGIKSEQQQHTAARCAAVLLSFAFDVRGPSVAPSIAARAGVGGQEPAKHRHGRMPCRCGTPSTREAQGTAQSAARTRGVLSFGPFSLHEQRKGARPTRAKRKISENRCIQQAKPAAEPAVNGGLRRYAANPPYESTILPRAGKGKPINPRSL
jgi:hypothetical protein